MPSLFATKPNNFFAPDVFQFLREELARGAKPDSQAFSLNCHRRLAKALSSSSTSAFDLCALLRHVLRRESEVQQGEQSLLLPRQMSRLAELTADDWQRFGLKAAEQGAHLQLIASAWYPTWLPVSDGAPSPEAAAFTEASRRVWPNVPGDPFLASSGHEFYRSEGQKEAVRAVLTTPPGGTLLVNLPTGAGKSLCAQILAKVPFAGAANEGVTVVIVPTTALCLDQERAVAHPQSVTERFAYYAGMNKNERQDVWRRIANGTQRIVFTSPESVIGSLKTALYAAARRGALKALVVDEAHTIEGWGDEFRPAFQELAGLRRGLMRACQESGNEIFRTLLLSATLTEASVATLQTLFGDPGPLRMVSSVQLRPEPATWLAPCHERWLPDAQRTQKARVLEALCHLPRPLILYTTRVEDAQTWRADLRALGFRRFAAMTGRTGSEQRAAIIEDWSNDKLDFVVATSAFGLGIDKSDVRAVLHACVPETLDRFYQEQGRGGRDGNASLSLMIYTQAKLKPHPTDKDDVELGATMNTRRIISIERGRQRWEQMFDNKVSLGNDRFRVRLDTSPGLSEADIDMQSVRNEEWNARTLTLLCRAGVLELDDEAPPEPTSNEDGAEEASVLTAAESEAAYTTASLSRVVRVINHEHKDAALWEQLVEPQRRRTEVAQREQWKLLQEVLMASTCASHALEKAYRLDGVLGANVARSCGGCAWCRAQGRKSFAEAPVVSPWPWEVGATVGARLASYTRGGSLTALFYPALLSVAQRTQVFRKLTRWMVGQGILHLVCAPETWDVVKGEIAPDVPVFLSTAPYRRDWPRVPTLLLAQPHEAPSQWVKWWRYEAVEGGYESFVMVVPDSMSAPDRPDWRLCDVAAFPHVRLEEWEMREAQ